MLKSVKKMLKKQAQQPRELVDIQKEYSNLVAKVGQAQYQAYIYAKATETLNKRMEEVNQEADERNKLDAANKQADTAAKAPNATA